MGALVCFAHRPPSSPACSERFLQMDASQQVQCLCTDCIDKVRAGGHRCSPRDPSPTPLPLMQGVCAASGRGRTL